MAITCGAMRARGAVKSPSPQQRSTTSICGSTPSEEITRAGSGHSPPIRVRHCGRREESLQRGFHPCGSASKGLALRPIRTTPFVVGTAATQLYFVRFVGFLARNAAPDVKREVATPVGPAYSISMKPVSLSMFRRSRTGIDPPIQSDQASRLLATSRGRSSFRMMSANWSRPAGLSTRKISRRLCSFNGDRLRTPFEITMSNVSLS